MTGAIIDEFLGSRKGRIATNNVTVPYSIQLNCTPRALIVLNYDVD